MKPLLTALVLMAGCSVEPSLRAAPPPDPTSPPSTTPSGPTTTGFEDVDLFQVIAVPLVRQGLTATSDIPPIAHRDAALRLSLAPPHIGTVTTTVRLVAPDQSLSEHTAQGSGDGELLIELPGDYMLPNSTWSVDVVDAQGRSLARFPESGTTPLSAEETGPLKVHLVPFQVAGFVPDASDAVVQGFRDALFAVYPVTDVVITVGDVVTDFNDVPLDMGNLLVHLGVLQEQIDEAPQDTYYYGLVTGAPDRDSFCESCPTGTSESGGGIRAAFAVGAAFGDARSESTLIHEMGHMHGLLHAPCGGADNVDPAFPHPDAELGTEGFDVRSWSFVSNDHRDLMSYCTPRWVSDYHYAKLIDWVQFAQGWSDTKPFSNASLGPFVDPYRCFDLD
ncbi:MAG: M66 family metalloprotease [Myxococcota bacterium]